MKKGMLLVAMLLLSFSFAVEKVTFDNNWVDNPLLNIVSEDSVVGLRTSIATQDVISEDMDIVSMPMVRSPSSFAIEKVIFENNWAKTPLFSVVSEKSSGVEIIFSTHEMLIEQMVLDEIPMKTFGIPGVFLPNDEGAPNIAGTGRYIAIPQDAKAKVTILDSRKEVYHNVEVAPAPNIPLDNDDSPLVYKKDMEIYSKDAYYPEASVKLSEPMKMRGVDVVVLGIMPFQYNPVTKELIVYKDIRVKVDFIGGNGHFGEERLRSRLWEPILQGNLLNYSSLPKIDFYAPERINPQDGYGYEYIIIVPDDALFKAWADTIKNWRRLQGISSEVFTLTEIGGSSYDDIKDFLKNAYETWDPAPVAFLLLSDYPSSGDSYGITSKWFWHPYSGTYVSDNWYAEMSGSTLPVMDYARICAQTESQLSTMINKFLSYERNPYTASNFYDEPLVACAWQTERWFQLCSEVIRGFFVNTQGKTPAREYAIYSGTPTPGCAWSTASNTATVVSYWSTLGYIPTTNQNGATWWNNGSSTGITNAINSGAFLVQHRDHGSETAWGEPYYSTTHLNNLTNNKFTFVYSSNCLTGRYDWSSQCFTEKFHRIAHGAMGVNAASQVSYSFVNDTYVWGCYDGLWPEFDPGYPGSSPAIGYNNLRPCQAMTNGKYYLSASGWPSNSGAKSITYRLFHHHGDAFSVLYSEVPQNLTVSHAATLTAGATSFTVTADDSSVIALTVNYEIVGVAQGTGSPVDILIEPQVPGNTMKVTVTRANYYRYEADVPIVPASGPYPIATTTIIDDAIGGNNDGLINPGEDIDYGVYLRNVGDQSANSVYAYLLERDPYITVNTDSSWYGDIAINDSSQSNPYYNFTVANNCPNHHTVACSLAIYDTNNDLYVSHTEFTVYAPVLVYVSNSVVNDNNGDAWLDPGETADLVVTIKNTGDVSAVSTSSTLKTASPYITINDASGDFGTINPRNTADNAADPYNITALGSTPGGTIVDFSVIVQSGVYCDTLYFSLAVGHAPPSVPVEGYVGPEYWQDYPKTAFGSTSYLVVWQDNRKANDFGPPYEIYGARVTTSGIILDPCGILIASGQCERPSVAFDGTNWFVVWGVSENLYGARVSQAGVVIDVPFPISQALSNQRDPAVSFNGTNYLVAWSDYRTPGNCADLYCARVTPAGLVLDPNGIRIQAGVDCIQTPCVTSSGSDWLVAWTVSGVTVRGARVGSNGTVLDPGGFIISSAANDRYLPDADFDGSNYLVVWQDRRNGTGSGGWDVYCSRVAQNGTVLDPAGIPLAAENSRYEGIPEISFNGTNYLVIWKDGGFTEIAGNRVTQDGDTLGSRFPISASIGYETYTDVVCDGANWLVVFTDYRYINVPDAIEFGWGSDIAGTRINASGTILDPYPNIPVSIAANWQYYSDAAFDGTNHLVVWLEKKETEHWDVHGTRISTDGTVLDIPTIPINSASGHQFYPAVAFGSTNYLVTWGSTNVPYSIYGARVGLDGTVLDPTGFHLGYAKYGYPAIAFDGTNYMVVWWKIITSTTARIYGARVTQDGVVLDPGGFEIVTFTSIPGYNVHVSLGLAFDGTNYLVVWPDGRNGDWDIYGARFTQNGTVLDPGGFAVCRYPGGDQDFPDLTFGAGNYFAVWHDGRNDGEIYGTMINPSGAGHDTTGILLSNNAPEAQSQPDISFAGGKYVVVWKDNRNGNPDIYGTRVDQEGALLDPDGFFVSTEYYRQFQPCVSGGSEGNALIAYSGFTEGYPYDASRLYHQIKTITPPDIVPPLAPYLYAEKLTVGNSVTLTWNKITTDILGNPEIMDHYTVYRSTSPDFIPGASDSIAGIIHPDTTFTDLGALNASQSYYYLVKAVDQALNRSSKSNMGYKLNKIVNENAGATGDRNWVSLPWHSEYNSVPDLTADLSPSGDPLSKITDLGDDQIFENWIHHPVLGWYGDIFDIISGRGYEMIAVADDTVILVGSNNPVGLIALNENAGAVGDRNWVSIPYNAIYDRAIDITDEYSSAGEAVIKITDLRDDQIFENWIHHPVLGWYGDAFDISAGRGYEFVAVLDTNWNPTEYTNESDLDRLVARQKKSDIKVYLGTLTKTDRAPVWFVEEEVSEKTVSRADIKTKKKELCLSEPKSEKSVKPADEHDAKAYNPVTRSLSSKKSLKLYREAGVSHLVRAEFDAKEFTDLVFTAYRLNKPYDVLTEHVIGCGIAQKHDLGVFWFDVGNFMRPWQHGEEVILIIEALHEHGAYCQVVSFKLDQGIDIQELGKLELEPMPVPEPILKTAVSWHESKNAQVIGYSVYQGDMRANHEVIQAQEYSSGEDITLRLVVKGGYETVYSSGSKRAVQEPIVNLPRVYAFTVYPNPFIKKTMINYALPEPTEVNIMIYDVTGRKVITLVNDRVDPGYYQVHWSGCDDLGRQVGAGVYFMRMNAPGFTSQQKVIFVH